MLAHRLRHRVEIQSRTQTQDPVTGEVTETWATATDDNGTSLASVPAEVLMGAGREFMQSGTEQADTTARINLRWFPGLTQKMRLVWDGRTYNIKSLEADASGRREWRLRCGDEGVNQG
jgi:SPP1 family predicted phage head-tail adaptor